MKRALIKKKNSQANAEKVSIKQNSQGLENVLGFFKTEDDYLHQKLIRGLLSVNHFEHESNFNKNKRFVTFLLSR